MASSFAQSRPGGLLQQDLFLRARGQAHIKCTLVGVKQKVWMLTYKSKTLVSLSLSLGHQTHN